jgi:murein DD-endopeptidase
MDHGQRSARVGIHLFRVSLYIGSLLLPLLALAATADKPAATADKPATKPLLSVPIQVAVPAPPALFPGNGQRHLVYEIRLMNWSAGTWTVQRIDVRSESGAALRSVEGKALADSLWHPGRRPEDKSEAVETLAPGESAVAFMWIDLAKGAPSPVQLRHEFKVKQAGSDAPMLLDAPTAVVLNKVSEITPPLRGKSWLAVNGPSNDSAHRRSTPVIDGAGHISQRYAIDWVQVGDDLLTHHGDPKDNRNYLCFGADVLAVADGVVVEVRDGIPENVPNASPVVPITLDTVAGNHINLDLGGGVFAMYAHLQPGSLRVKLGEKVKRGQVLALLGNTGNSTEPHLHFQLMDRNSPLSSEGLPYALSEFVVTKRVAGEFPQATATPLAAPEVHRGEMPMEMQLVNFE